MTKARQIAVLSSGQVAFQDIELGPLTSRGVLVRAIYSGFSQGAERRKVLGQGIQTRWDEELRQFTADAKEPSASPLGYENVGEIIEVGANEDRHLVGRVIWAGEPHQNVFVAEAAAIDGHVLPTTPGAKDLWRFAFLARLRVALNGVHDAEILVGENVLVVGGGTLGSFCGLLARRSGARNVFLADVSAEALALGERLGLIPVPADSEADLREMKRISGPEGIDKVIEASGTYEGLQTALRSVRLAGHVVALGTYAGGGSPLNLGAEWSRNRVTLVSSMSVNDCPSRHYPGWTRQRLDRMARELLAAGHIDPADLNVRTVPFSDAMSVYQGVAVTPLKGEQIVFSYR
jgi:threonine dehydrogenase-like Zn-dependent dehydrogenase